MLSANDFMPFYPDQRELDVRLKAQNIVGNSYEYMRFSPGNNEKGGTKRGEFYNSQKLSILYNSNIGHRMLLAYEPGLGKTPMFLGACELHKKNFINNDGTIRGVMLFAKGKPLTDQAMNQLKDKCTPDGMYNLPEEKETSVLKRRPKAITTKMKSWYEHKTFITFLSEFKKELGIDNSESSNWIQELKNNPHYVNKIRTNYSNKLLVFDESHNFNQSKSLKKPNKKLITDAYHLFSVIIELTPSCHAIFVTATPSVNSPQEMISLMNMFIYQKIDMDKDIITLSQKQRAALLIKHWSGYISYMNKEESDAVAVLMGTTIERKSKTGIISKVNLVLHAMIDKPDKDFIILPKSKQAQFICQKEAYLNQVKLTKESKIDLNTNIDIEDMDEDSSSFERSKFATSPKGSAIRVGERQCSNFIFPDGSFLADKYDTFMDETSKTKNQNNKGTRGEVGSIISYRSEKAILRSWLGVDYEACKQNLPYISPKYLSIMKTIMAVYDDTEWEQTTRNYAFENDFKIDEDLFENMKNNPSFNLKQYIKRRFLADKFTDRSTDDNKSDTNKSSKTNRSIDNSNKPIDKSAGDNRSDLNKPSNKTKDISEQLSIEEQKFMETLNNTTYLPLKNMYRRKGITFIYIEFKVTGAYILQFLLERLYINGVKLQTLSPYQITSTGIRNGSVEKKPRVALISERTGNIHNILDILNMPENANGEYCMIAIGTNVARQGISINNVIDIHLINSSYNTNAEFQALNRGFRKTSHIEKVKQYRDAINEDNAKYPVNVYKHASYIKDGNKEISVDIDLAIASDIKDTLIRAVELPGRQLAFDAPINCYPKDIKTATKIDEPFPERDVLTNILVREKEYAPALFQKAKQIDYSNYDLLYSENEINTMIEYCKKKLFNFNCILLKDLFNDMQKDIKCRMSLFYLMLLRISRTEISLKDRFNRIHYVQTSNKFLYLCDDLNISSEREIEPMLETYYNESCIIQKIDSINNARLKFIDYSRNSQDAEKEFIQNRGMPYDEQEENFRKLDLYVQSYILENVIKKILEKLSEEERREYFDLNRYVDLDGKIHIHKKIKNNVKKLKYLKNNKLNKFERLRSKDEDRSVLEDTDRTMRPIDQTTSEYRNQDISINKSLLRRMDKTTKYTDKSISDTSKSISMNEPVLRRIDKTTKYTDKSILKRTNSVVNSPLLVDSKKEVIKSYEVKENLSKLYRILLVNLTDENSFENFVLRVLRNSYFIFRIPIQEIRNYALIETKTSNSSEKTKYRNSIMSDKSFVDGSSSELIILQIFDVFIKAETSYSSLAHYLKVDGNCRSSLVFKKEIIWNNCAPLHNPIYQILISKILSKRYAKFDKDPNKKVYGIYLHDHDLKIANNERQKDTKNEDKRRRTKGDSCKNIADKIKLIKYLYDFNILIPGVKLIYEENLSKSISVTTIINVLQKKNSHYSKMSIAKIIFELLIKDYHMFFGEEIDINIIDEKNSTRDQIENYITKLIRKCNNFLIKNGENKKDYMYKAMFYYSYIVSPDISSNEIKSEVICVSIKNEMKKQKLLFSY